MTCTDDTLSQKVPWYKINPSKNFKYFWLEFIAIGVLSHGIVDPQFQPMTRKRQKCLQAIQKRAVVTDSGLEGINDTIDLWTNWLIGYFVSVPRMLGENCCWSVWGECRAEPGIGRSGKDQSLCPCRYCCPLSSQTAKIQDAKVVRIDKTLKE